MTILHSSTDARRNPMPAIVTYGVPALLGLVGVIAPIFG